MLMLFAIYVSSSLLYANVVRYICSKFFDVRYICSKFFVARSCCTLYICFKFFVVRSCCSLYIFLVLCCTLYTIYVSSSLLYAHVVHYIRFKFFVVRSCCTLYNVPCFLLIQTDVTALSGAMTQIGVDQNVIPLGRLKKETLMKARDILSDLEYVSHTNTRMHTHTYMLIHTRMYARTHVCTHT